MEITMKNKSERDEELTNQVKEFQILDMRYFKSVINETDIKNYCVNGILDHLIIEKIILTYKILQIKIYQSNYHEDEDTLYYEYKEEDGSNHFIDNQTALLKLEGIINKLNIKTPEEITRKELDAYQKNLNFNIESEKKVLSYDYFNDFICGRFLYDNNFDCLKELYKNNKLEFYSVCKKSRKYNQYFVKSINNYEIKIYFQTDNYDETYKRFIDSISYFNCAKKYADKKIKKIRINGLDIIDEYNNLTFTIRESSHLTYSNIECKKITSRGSMANYINSYREINLFYNEFLEPDLRDTKFRLYHELGHFVHNVYLEIANKNNKIDKVLENFYIKDYCLSFSHEKELRSPNLKDYYKYVGPPLNISAKRSKTLNNDSSSSEMFAEIFRMNLLNDNYVKKLQIICPHINYLIFRILNGKGVNKYKKLT